MPWGACIETSAQVPSGDNARLENRAGLPRRIELAGLAVEPHKLGVGLRCSIDQRLRRYGKIRRVQVRADVIGQPNRVTDRREPSIVKALREEGPIARKTIAPGSEWVSRRLGFVARTTSRSNALGVSGTGCPSLS